MKREIILFPLFLLLIIFGTFMLASGDAHKVASQNVPSIETCKDYMQYLEDGGAPIPEWEYCKYVREIPDEDMIYDYIGGC